MMKNLLIVFTVLAMASTTNAALLLSVNGVVDPPDSDITLAMGGTAVIDVWGDGQTQPGGFFLGVAVGGLGVIDPTNAQVLYGGSEAAILEFDDPDTAALLGLNNPFTYLELTDLAVPPLELTGTLADGVVFTCNGLEDVTIMLLDLDGNVTDTQVIHQIPEPITLALVGFGGLFLRRRK